MRIINKFEIKTMHITVMKKMCFIVMKIKSQFINLNALKNRLNFLYAKYNFLCFIFDFGLKYILFMFLTCFMRFTHHTGETASFNHIKILCISQVLVIIDVKPKDLGLPTEAYISVEEVHDVSTCVVLLYIILFNVCHANCWHFCWRMELPRLRRLNMWPVRLEQKRRRKWV